MKPSRLKRSLAGILGGVLGVASIQGIPECVSVSAAQVTVVRNDQGQMHPTSLKVMTYNIAHGRGLESSNFDIESKEQLYKNLDGIVATILKENPDVVGLNEVDFDSNWSFNVDELEYIAKKTNMPYYVKSVTFHLDTKIYHFKFGDAVLSKYPIISSSSESYKEDPSRIGARRLLKTEIMVGDRTLNFLLVHLTPYNPSLRQKQLRQALEASKLNPNSTILLGDFNISPFYHAVKWDKKAWELVMNTGLFNAFEEEWLSEENRTYPSHHPTRILDYIFVTKNFKVESYYSVDVKYSDHKPVVCVIKF